MTDESGAMTIAEFRAAHNLTTKRFSALVREGNGPDVCTRGRAKIVTAEAAQAWAEAEGRRVVAALTFAAQIGVDGPGDVAE